ncbi:MAG: hydrolase, partial [Cytophagales bacterium]
MKLSSLLLFSFCFTFSFCLFAQKNVKNYQLAIPKLEKEVIIDGELNEDIWQKAEKISKFYQNFPYDTSFAEAKTDVMMTYDDNFVYIGVTCYDTKPEMANVAQTLRRDFDPSVN